MRPNVILLVLDAARRDSLEPYGARVGDSPAIADLALRGAALPYVFSTGCWTIPSHASLFTGLMPRAAGLADAPGGSMHACKSAMEGHSERLLPEVLRRAGYSTSAVSANLWLSEASGFSIGFDDFVSVDSGRQGQIHGRGLRPRVEWALESVVARADDGAAEMERILDEWLERPPAQPFFWFVNLVECHSPYLPPRPYGRLSPWKRLLAAEDARRHLTLGSIWRACAGDLDISGGALERMRSLYRGAIRYMDDWIARLLERLERRRLLDDTLVIVTADHGENLGEAGLIAHSLSLDNRLIHVPLVAAGPGAPSNSDAVSLAGLPRLIADGVGVADHPWRTDALPRGMGLAQFDPPTSRSDPRAAYAAGKWGLDDGALERLTTPLTCATDGHLKVLRRGDREEVYDLAADPLEVNPMSFDGVAASNGDRLRRLRQGLNHPAVLADSTRPSPPAADQPRQSAEEAAELEERMRLLGYL